MADERQAVAEGILGRIWKEEWHDLELLLSRTGNAQFWADVMRYELDLGTLTKGLLRPDTSLDALKDFHVHSLSPFHYAGLRGTATVLRKGLQVGLNVEVGLRSGTTVLHLASFAGQMEIVALLVDEFKANVNREDGHHCRPLHYASAQGHQRVVEFLVNRGGDIGARDSAGTTAAYHARRRHHQPIVSFLLDISGDGDDLLVEEESLTNEAQTVAGNAIPLYTNVCKKNKRRLQAALDYEEVEPSSDWDTRVETVEKRQDADEKGRPTDKKKDPKNTEKIMTYETKQFPLASTSLLDTECGRAYESKMQDNNGERDTPACDEERHGLKTSREDCGHTSDSLRNSRALSERGALDQCEASNEATQHKQQSGRRTPRYEEITLSNDSVTDLRVPHGHESAEESIPTKKGGFTRRNHTYEEFELPSDTMLHSEMGLQKSDACAESAELDISSFSPDQNSNISNESATTTEEEIIPIIDISKFVRRPHPYEEIEIPCDEIDITKFVRKPHPYEEIKLPCEETDMSKFVRRSHTYEEIKLPGEEDTNRIPMDKQQVEQDVRQLLRTELRKLELLGQAIEVENFFRDSDKDFNGSNAISNIFNVSKIAENGASNSNYDTTAVITLRQLQRVLREEFDRFADQLRSKESVSKSGVQGNEDLKTDETSTSTLVSSATGLYEELTTCNWDEAGIELGKVETVKHATRREPRGGVTRKEIKQLENSPTRLQQTTDQGKLEITEQKNKESKLNFSPLLLRRDPRNRKEKGNDGRSPHRSPLRLNAQDDKEREATEPKTDRNLQKPDALSAKTGQSQFYVSLGNDKKHSEI